MKIFIFRESEMDNLNPDILGKRGLGATETSFILLSQGLGLNNDVVVCCPCEERKKYGNVEYIPYKKDYAQIYIEVGKFKPDVVIVVGNPQILFKNDFKDYKVIFWQHNHPMEMKHFPVIKLFERDNVRVVFPSPESAEQAKGFYHKENIWGIYNSIRDDFLNYKEIPKVKNKICYLASFARSKGLYETLVTSKSLEGYKIHVLGDFNMYGTFDKSYHDLCSPLLKNTNIVRSGLLFPPNLVNEIVSSEICIVNPIVGNKETCCVCALEAMAVGTPVVAGGKSIIDPIISNGGISHFGNLAEVVKSLMGDDKKRKELKNSGQKWAKQFSKENVANKWIKFLED